LENLKSLIDQLKAIGITPQVNIAIPAEQGDVEGIKALRTQLLQAGITPQIHINLGLSEAITPGTQQPPEASKTSKGASFTVVVKDNKLNCFTFTQKDGGGKPIFEIREPRIQFFRGARISVSADHKAGDKDLGDGTIIGTGGIRFYFIVDSPSKPEAVGLYVRQSEVERA
jgi:hypothetical protein